MKSGTKSLLLLLGGLGLTIFGVVNLVFSEQHEVSIIETNEDSTDIYLLIGIMITIAAIVRIVRERRK